MPGQKWKGIWGRRRCPTGMGSFDCIQLAPHFAQDDSVGKKDSGISETLDLVASAPLRGRGRPRYTTWAVT